MLHNISLKAYPLQYLAQIPFKIPDPFDQNINQSKTPRKNKSLLVGDEKRIRNTKNAPCHTDQLEVGTEPMANST